MNNDSITIKALLEIALCLKSEDNENLEYDRALVEICTEAAGLPLDEKGTIADQLGIQLGYCRGLTVR